MSGALRISLTIGIMLYLIFILYLLRKKKLNLKYSLLWLLTVVIMLIMTAFPKLVTVISNLIGIESPINTIFLVFIFFILLILISLTSIVSKQNKEIKTLIQNLAILTKEADELKKKNNE